MWSFPGFSHTVLVVMRARLARSDDPDRILNITVQAARSAGLVSSKRALDSTPIYDAVATQEHSDNAVLPDAQAPQRRRTGTSRPVA